MAYPDYPSNRLIVNGRDLSSDFNLILMDGYTLDPPSIKTHTVDIPAGNGVIDLTETLYGDVTYENREQSFTFAVIDTNEFERVKTKVSNFLHGRRFSYTMTMDPGYTYNGRFSVSSYYHNVKSGIRIGYIVINIDSDAYKYLPKKVYRIPAVGGKIVRFESGRKRVVPTIEVGNAVTIIKNNKITKLPIGTWKINDLYFSEGYNEVYFNTFLIRNLQCKDLYFEDNDSSSGVTWGEFSKKRLFEWYKSNGDGTIAQYVWKDLSVYSWGDQEITSKRWSELMYMSDVTSDIKDIYIEYEVGDL